MANQKYKPISKEEWIEMIEISLLCGFMTGWIIFWYRLN